jgi:hypothetical protein
VNFGSKTIRQLWNLTSERLRLIGIHPAFRCEWEGFIAVVDPEESRFLHLFVEKSDIMWSLLPYPKEYERESFIPPSYNAIDILTYCVSGMPAGINLPKLR